MNSAEVALVAQILALVTQAVSAAIAARKNLSDNASATEQANLASAHDNFQKIIASANALLNPAA